MGVMFLIILVVAGVSVYDYFDSRDWQSATSISRNSLIFEHRNKKYGAYNLRRDYNDSFGIIIFCVILFFAIFFIISIIIWPKPVKLPPPAIDMTVMTIAAPPMEEIKTIKTPYKIIGGGGGGSAGTASTNPVDKTPKEQTMKEPVIKESYNSKASGRSDHTDSKNPNKNPATTLVKGKSPFGGGAAKSGEGSGIFGKDQGPGSGTGEGNGTNGIGSGNGGGARKRLTSLNNDDIQSNVDCIIYLKVHINAEGNVIRVDNDSKRTTTTNETLITRVRELVKQQIKYDKRAGAAVQIQPYTVNVNAR